MRGLLVAAFGWLAIWTPSASIGAPAPAYAGAGPVCVRVRFGLRESEPATWTGTYRATGGRIAGARGCLFAGNDFATASQFRVRVRYAKRFSWHRGKHASQHSRKRRRTYPNGVVLTLTDVKPGCKLTVATQKGEFEIALRALPYGKYRAFLGRQVEVERVPHASLVVDAPSADAFPSAAVRPDGALCVAYVAFAPGKGFDAPLKLDREMKDFTRLAEPAGGDRVMFVERVGGQWSQPVALTPPGGDVFRTATAVDGAGRVWVIWSANQKGNWDLYASRRDGERWSKPARLTSDPGSDVNHAATTDSEGRVWIAWQGFRSGQSDIFALRQEGDGFGEPVAVHQGPANEWRPAIAASHDGQVAVAWDTYARGRYDVRLRTWGNGAWRPAVDVAKTNQAERLPSLAYDPRNRLWIAYEIAPENWGKDFGLYDRKPGNHPLYLRRSIGVKVWDGEKLLVPEHDVAKALPMPAGERRSRRSGRAALAAEPRLATDGQGRVWLSKRVCLGKLGQASGGVWVSYLTTVDAQGWRTATAVPLTDALLQDTPALVGTPASGLCMVSVCDGRLRAAATYAAAAQAKPAHARAGRAAPPARDELNWNIAVAETGALGPWEAPKLKPDRAKPTPLTAEAAEEAANVKQIRGYRVHVGGKTFRILRGDFHRHTEISADGMRDGSLYDAWRYGLDVAALDWMAATDHDYGCNREYTWWATQKSADVFHLPQRFSSLFGYERSRPYPDGHRNILFAKRGVRPLPAFPKGAGKPMDSKPPDEPRPSSPATQMLYRYLHQFHGLCVPHTSATLSGTDWRDHDPVVEPAIEIYQGARQSYERAGAPRAAMPDYAIGGWKPLGLVDRALRMGRRYAFVSCSDHISTHISYTCVLAETNTREAIFNAIKRRRVYAATDNIIADVRCGEHIMG